MLLLLAVAAVDVVTSFGIGEVVASLLAETFSPELDFGAAAGRLSSAPEVSWFDHASHFENHAEHYRVYLSILFCLFHQKSELTWLVV